MYVYLAGPITGLKYQDANDWRENPLLISSLAKHGYVTLNPLRDKVHLGEFRSDPLPSRYTLEQEEMETSADIADIKASAVVLANLRDATHASIGTCWELGFAYALGKPIVTVLDPGGVHDHLFVHRASMRVVESMFEAVAELAILAPKLREPAYA